MSAGWRLRGPVMAALAIVGLTVAGIALLGLGVTLTAVPAGAAPIRYGECEVDVLGGAPGTMVVVTVGNRGVEPFGPVTVQLWRENSQVGQALTGALAPRVSAVVRLAVPRDAAGAYLLVGYDVGGIRREVAAPLPGPGRGGADDPPGGVLLAWSTPLLGFVGALLGVWLGHVTTARRERTRIETEARWKAIDRDAPAYREFLDYWQDSTSASHLESAFDQLRSAASVPAEVVREYDRTLEVLRAGHASDDDRRRAVERLHGLVDGLRTHQG